MQEAIETATLLVSELMTNAIQASDYESRQRTCPEADEAQPISLTLRLLPARLVIEVFDNNPDPPILSEAAADAESGRVLAILQVLSKEWGHYGLPSGGKIVFCVLSPPDAAASDIQHNMLTPDSGTAPHR